MFARRTYHNDSFSKHRASKSFSTSKQKRSFRDHAAAAKKMERSRKHENPSQGRYSAPNFKPKSLDKDSDYILLQQPDLTNRHTLRRCRATPLRSPRRHPLHLSLLRRHLPRPVPRVGQQTSQSPGRTPRSLLLRPRIPLQGRLLSSPSTQQTQKCVGA